jgi:hypothetical protein
MSLNLSRSTKLYVSTVKTGWSTANTFEIPVLDGYSFSQDAATQEVTLSEAGEAPVRGKKIFNTALNPAAISISTYARPFYNVTHNAVERVLWEALVGSGPLNTNTVSGATYFEADFENSNVHQLLKLQFYFVLENTTYLVEDVIVNTAEVDFSIDGIASIAWSGQGTAVTEKATGAYPTTGEFLAIDTAAEFITNKLSVMSLSKATGTTSAYWTVDFGNTLLTTNLHTLVDATIYTAEIAVDGGAAQVISIDPAATSPVLTGGTVADVINEINQQLDNAYIALVDGDLIVTSITSGASSSIAVTEPGVNDLFTTLDTTSFVALGAQTGGTGTLKAYTVAITGGSLTIDNGVTFLTPEELGVVNTPIGSFTGARSVSGSVTCYLNTGANNSGGLLSDLVSDTSTVTQEFELLLKIGGNATPRVEFDMKHTHLVIPAVSTADVLGLDISFSALGQDIDTTDELLVRYFATP